MNWLCFYVLGLHPPENSAALPERARVCVGLDAVSSCFLHPLAYRREQHVFKVSIIYRSRTTNIIVIVVVIIIIAININNNTNRGLIDYFQAPVGTLWASYSPCRWHWSGTSLCYKLSRSRPQTFCSHSLTCSVWSILLSLARYLFLPPVYFVVDDV